MRIFGVDYPFLSCGSVFTDGLAHAAVDLGVEYAHTRWDDPALCDRVAAFRPDLLFVVHGRQFARRFGADFSMLNVPTAVWLLDEPYEVDDTATFSPRFDHVFISDPATLHRHDRATYLPVCYDPRVHRPGAQPIRHRVGFVGGANSTRERYLGAIARAGLLDYVVGGDWHDPAVQAKTLSRNIAPVATAALYGQTAIVLNVFRETHHFNREGVPATSLNPRVYEAFACGALVVSEWRPEVDTLVPDLPTFDSEEGLVELVRGLLDDPAHAGALRATCAARLANHTYAERLQTVMATVVQAVSA